MTEPTKEQMDLWWANSRCNVPVKYMAMTLAYTAGFGEGRKYQYPRLSERANLAAQHSKFDPTPDQVDQWWDQAMWGPETPYSSTYFIACRAAAWAREQALDEAEQAVRAAINKRRPWYEFAQEQEVYDAIRALKEKK